MPGVDVGQPGIAARGHRRSRGRFGRFLRRGTVTGRLPAFLLAVGLSVLVAGFLSAKEYTVRSVVVYGNQLTFVDTIVASSGALGQPLFWLDTEAVAQRVAAHPAVAAAEVRAVFPDQVLIRLHEREPVVVWRQGEQAVLVDGEGWVIAAGDRSELPHIEQVEGALPAPGTRLPAGVVQAVIVLRERLGQRAVAFEYSEQTGISVELNNGRIVHFGMAERLPEQLQVLEAVEQAGVDWANLDLRDPERPVLW